MSCELVLSSLNLEFSWGPLLRDVSRLDTDPAEKSNSMAEQIKQQIANGQYGEATNTWSALENFITENSNSVDFYNFLLDSDQDPLSTTTVSFAPGLSMKRYSRYLSSKASSKGDVNELMNGVIREKLKIIPKDVRWGGQSDLVFRALSNDFMKPRIAESAFTPTPQTFSSASGAPVDIGAFMTYMTQFASQMTHFATQIGVPLPPEVIPNAEPRHNESGSSNHGGDEDNRSLA